jgi:hypothetical protein
MATLAESEVARLKIDIDVVNDDIRAFQERLQNPDLTPLQRGTAQRNLDRAQARLVTLQAELAKAQTAVSQQAAPNPQPEPPATAAKTVQDDAPKGPTAGPEQKVEANGRITPVENTGATNAEVAPTLDNGAGVTTGVNEPVKSVEQTQVITANSNSGEAVPAQKSNNDNDANATGNASSAGTPVVAPAAVAPDDDANTDSKKPQQAVNATETTQIKVTPRPNVLDEYASYTYSASVYLMTEAQYARLLQSSIKKIDGYQLLFQSGGAPNNVGGIRKPPSSEGTEAAPGADGGRNPYFDNDFYIDSISIENLPAGKATGSAHNISGMKFTLVEPNGITLLDRLYDAVANSRPKGADGKVNYTAATYLMVIRFYGYDSEGNLEQVRSKTDQEGTSDPGSIIEKFIPFRIKGINWSVGTKLVSYEWDCVPIGQLIAGYASRGTIPYDVQLVDSTVGGLLGGAAKYSEATTTAANPGSSTTTSPTSQGNSRENSPGPSAAPPKANAAPNNKKTITNGLVGAMNDFQKKLVQDGIFTYADEYVIKFVGDGADKIENADLQLPNSKVEKRLTAAGQPATQDTQALDQNKQSVDMISRSFSITAGQQLLQAIELSIRNSSYIYNQALVIINADGTTQPNPNSRNQPLKWFTISMSAEPISKEIDPKRNDYAYRITYTVSPRIVKNVISKYFPVSKFTGVHKSYPYWFTGQNIAVLEYQESMNAMYQLTVSGSDTETSAANKTRQQYTSSMSDIITYNHAPRSTESSHGASGKQNELGANAAEVLYSPSDLRECKLRIVGDPAWIMQGSLVRLPKKETFVGDSVSTGFLPDGSIAFDNQDVLFEISWQRPEDYDISSGLADPYSVTQKKYNNRTALQSRVYLCKKVLSEFKQGAFTQTLEGALYLFPVPNKSNTANPSAAASTSTAGGTNTNGTENDAVDRVQNAKPAAQGRPSAAGSGSGAGSAQFAATGPRRLDIGDGGKAAILGAQRNTLGVPPASTSASSDSSGVPADNGVLDDSQIQNAPPPNPPTSDVGDNVSAVPSTVNSGPPKLPAAGQGQNTLTVEQRREVARAGDEARAAFIANRDAENEQRLAASGTPVSSSIPNNQKISRDY